MADEKYNGWTNIETWNLALQIDNDQGWYEESRRVVGKAAGSKKSPSKSRAADALKEWMEGEVDLWAESMGVDKSPMWTIFLGDVINRFFGRVDWYEIAENWLTDLDDDYFEEDDEEDEDEE